MIAMLTDTLYLGKCTSISFFVATHSCIRIYVTSVPAIAILTHVHVP